MHDGATRSVAQPSARRRRATASLWRRSAGTAIRCSRQARRPADRLAAGIDAASMARRCQCPYQKWRWFFFTRPGAGAAGWAGAWIAGNRDVAGGSPRSANHVVERGPTASARTQSKLRNPRNPSRPGEDSGARERRAKPLPTLPHTKAVASAKRTAAADRGPAAFPKKLPRDHTESSTISLRLRRRLNSLQPCALRRPFAHHCDSGSATRNTHPALPDRPRAHVYRCEASASC